MDTLNQVISKARQVAQEKTNIMMDLIVNKGNYSSVEHITYEQYMDFINKNIFYTLDLFCPKCNHEKTFVKQELTPVQLEKSIKHYSPIESDMQYAYVAHELKYICPTCGKQIAFYLYYNREKNKIIKIGQYPSFYDISRDELKEYQKSSLISDDDIKQLYKAYTCASESYFVAAYTYMRRVFENLLISAFTTYQDEISLSEKDFRGLRSDEKLEKLKAFLAIDDEIYKPLYALLSVGIHALTEEECGENFELLKSILLDILAEQKAKKEKEEKRKQIKALYSKKEAERKANNNATDEKQRN